jgi:hypothetical protein
MRRMLARGALAVCVFFFWCGAASALPTFARRYQVSCNLCHTGYPKLNNVGQSFKDRGFRLERETSFDSREWLNSLPISGRAVFSHSFVEGSDSLSEGVVKLVSAGNLGDRLSYWVDDGLRFYSEPDEEPTHVEPDNAYIRYELSGGARLHVRGGRMEMDLPFTQTRSAHLFAYDVYDAFGRDSLGVHKDGMELGGAFKGDARWSLGFFTGDDSERNDDFSVFLRAATPYRLHRFGAFAHLGANAPEDARFYRYGLDWSLWFARLNVYGLVAVGRYGDEHVVKGAFLQSDYHLEERVAITARVSVIDRPSYTTLSPYLAPPSAERRFAHVAFFPGVQIRVIPRFRVSFEYGFLNQDRKSRGRLQADLVL